MIEKGEAPARDVEFGGGPMLAPEVVEGEDAGARWARI